MKVAQIWRYPVKSMADGRLDRALIGPLGIEGDRVVHVEKESEPAKALTYEQILDCVRREKVSWNKPSGGFGKGRCRFHPAGVIPSA